jgi:hypothetical protein
MFTRKAMPRDLDRGFGSTKQEGRVAHAAPQQPFVLLGAKVL